MSMNEVIAAVVVIAPGSDGWGSVSLRDSTRRCFFDPFRFMAPWQVPTVGQRFFVTDGINGLMAIWRVTA